MQTAPNIPLVALRCSPLLATKGSVLPHEGPGLGMGHEDIKIHQLHDLRLDPKCDVERVMADEETYR
jgi:hypothetical protein